MGPRTILKNFLIRFHINPHRNNRGLVSGLSQPTKHPQLVINVTLKKNQAFELLSIT